MTRRRAIAIAGLALAAASSGLVSLMHGRGGASPRMVDATVEIATVAASAPAGGAVREVLVHPGDRVKKGQPLVRFDAGALLERRREVVSAVNSARELSALPRAAASIAVEAHPDVLKAESAYAAVAAAFEQGHASRAELDQAAASRIESRKRAAASLTRSTRGAGGALDTLESLLREIDRAISDHEARSPEAGLVAILDLHPGDRILPGAPVAVVAVAGKYMCEAALPPGTTLAAGAALRGIADDGAPITATVERVWRHEVPAALREDRSAAEEALAQLRLSSRTPIAPGSVVRLEIP